MSTDKFKHLREVYKAVREILPEGELGLVGGCVRDSLLGYTPKDFDFTTNLTPEQVEEFAKKAGRHVYTTGKAYGTIGFKVEVIEHNDYDYEFGFGPQWEAMGKFVLVEVTTYRKEKYRSGSRKPEVAFGNDLREDLKRRDFTINSLWFGSKDPTKEPELLDLFCGRLHLNDGLIKAVGEAQDMIRDDPLRILRAIRFAAKYNFKIDQYLWGICCKHITKLWDVAIERQVVELDKTLTSPFRLEGFNLLDEVGYLKQFLPELYTEIGEIDIPETEDSNMAWKGLLHSVGTVVAMDKKGEVKRTFIKKRHDFLCEGIASRFKFSNNRTKTILGTNKDGVQRDYFK